jgi:uncharacterized protein YndB with AHSA1/START domain/uncharacterized damage-inducible protein DinB
MTDTPPAGTRILGSVRSEGGEGVVRMQDRVDSSIEEVWSALTEPSRLARWYGEVEGDLRIGGEYRARLHASGWEGTGRVEACEPPRRLLVTAKQPDDPAEGSIEVTLASDGDQTIVVWETRGMPVNLLAAYGAGIQIHVEDLAAYLAGRERCDARARWAELNPAYEDLAADVGASADTIGDQPADGQDQVLLEFLAAQREAVLSIVEGLDEQAWHQSVVPTGWTPAGLVEHLGGAEFHWFQMVVAGEEMEMPEGEEMEPYDPMAAFVTDMSSAEVIAQYRDICARSDAVLAETPLSARPRGRHGDYEPPTVRWVVLHMIEETARHAGHLDLARELLDGRTRLGSR